MAVIDEHARVVIDALATDTNKEETEEVAPKVEQCKLRLAKEVTPVPPSFSDT